MIMLVIDASTYAGSVALVDGARVVAEESVAMKGADVERLMPAVAAVLARSRVTAAQLDRVVCGAGPGSFTSLRIAGSIAKGIAMGAGKPLFAVPSMALLVGGALIAEGSRLGAGRYLAAIDAMRGEWYVGLYEIDSEQGLKELERARIVASDALEPLATEYDARLVSSSPLPGSEAAIVAAPRAAAVTRLGAWLDEAGPVDLASWEPAYGRLAEAQVKWETAHGRPLPAG